MYSRITTLIVFILIISLSYGSSRDARAIMEQNDRQMTTRDEQSEFTMKLINKRGKERKRQVIMYSVTNQQDDDKTLIRFMAPADVKGVGLLSVEEGEAENQWLYLPALKRVRRISSSEKSDSFMGSDFSYEDVEQNELDDYKYTFLREENIEGIECYVIESVPVSQKIIEATAYSKAENWIRKDNYLSMKVNFYNHQGELMKIMTSRDIRLIGDSGKWRAFVLEMQNLKTGHRTKLYYKNININQGIEEKYFTRRYLEKRR